ncbi:MAG: cation:proton antiporter [Rhodospirillales bacterium]
MENSPAEAVIEDAQEAVSSIGDATAAVVTGVIENGAHGAAHGNLTEIAIVALAAMGCGLIMERFRQPAIVGYIVAGVILGPSAFGLVNDRAQIDMLAELGVLLLLYVIGMELSLRAFRRVWRLATMMTLIQIAASMLVMLVFWYLLDWSIGLTILLAFVIALSSTAVAIKILDGLGELRTRTGMVTVGVLIAQDLAVVPMMLVVSALGAADGGVDWSTIPKVLISVGVLAGLIVYLSSGRKLSLPFLDAAAGHPDLKPLAALAFCFAAAGFSGLLGLSAAYGAFLAGLVIGSSRERHAMIEATQPIQSILLMVFFLSIGLLLDLNFIWSHIWEVLTLFVFVAVFKTVLNVGGLRLLGQSWHNSFMAGIMLTQIGEFSFILSRLGVDAGVITNDDSRYVVAVTVLSLALSPLFVVTARRLQDIAMETANSASEILRLVYAAEAEIVADRIDEAKSTTHRSYRIANFWRRSLIRALRKRHARRIASTDTSAAKQADAEVVPEASPPNDLTSADGGKIIGKKAGPKKTPQKKKPQKKTPPKKPGADA